MDAFNEMTRTIAIREHVTLVDGDAAVPKSLEMFDDDCHYTADGTKRLATTVVDTLKNSGLITAAGSGNR
jgi:hypothetical protein